MLLPADTASIVLMIRSPHLFSFCLRHPASCLNAVRCFSVRAGPEVTVVHETATGAAAVQASEPQLLFHRTLSHMEGINSKILEPRQTWIHNFENTDESDKRGLIPLHPLIFSTYPRVDLIQQCIEWQKNYREVDWTCIMTREEMYKQGPRPWPQKGTGRARHKDKRSPIWMEGGWSHPPRGPKSKFYMLPLDVRVQGLASALAAKFAQNDLMIVDTLDRFPLTEPDEMQLFVSERSIGPSVLIVDAGDMFPRNISLATEAVSHINLMPIYGLNVYSMLKHETLVMTVAALQLAEQRLLFNMSRSDAAKRSRKYSPPPVCQDRDPFLELPTVDYLNGDMDDLH